MTFLDQAANSTALSSTVRDASARSIDAASHHMTDGEAGFLTRHRRSALLNRAVEAEILPRLALARAGAVGKPAVAHADAVANADAAATQNDTQELVRRLLEPEHGSAGRFIEQLEGRGITPAMLYLGIITGAARRLGELWDEDLCDFTQVTISLGRLQQIVRALSPSFQTAAVNQSAQADSVLLLPAPGEQHTFGLVLLSEFFRREGWQLAGGPLSTGYDAPGLVRGSWIDVVGFSIGSIKHLGDLTTCIRAIRRASRNRYLGVMVGGPLILGRPDLVRQVGADTTAADAPGAVRQARGLLMMQAAAD